MHICSCFALALFLSELIIPMFGPYLLLQNVQSGIALKDNVIGFGLRYLFDFKSTLAKYLGFLMHLSWIELKGRKRKTILSLGPSWNIWPPSTPTAQICYFNGYLIAISQRIQNLKDKRLLKPNKHQPKYLLLRKYKVYAKYLA